LQNLVNAPKWLYWRSKQCLDVSLNMAYCAVQSQYYLHLEDDVICTDHFYQKMMNEIQHLTDEQWCTVKFCELGFIGLLFQNTELNKLSTFIKCFPSLFQHIGYYSSLIVKRQPLQSASFEAILILFFVKRNQKIFNFLEYKIGQQDKFIKINNKLSFFQKLRNWVKK